MKDPYEILGLPRNATPSEIKKAYKSLASRYHPDKHLGNELEELAREKLRDLNEAYATLSDPNRRASYDATGRNGTASGAPTAYPAGPGPDQARIVGSIIRFVVVLSIVIFSFRFIRSPRAMAVIAVAILVAWFLPRLIKRFKSRK